MKIFLSMPFCVYEKRWKKCANNRTTKEKKSNLINAHPVLLRGKWQSKKWIAIKHTFVWFVNKCLFPVKFIYLTKFTLRCRWKSIESQTIWSHLLLQSVALCKKDEFHVSVGPPQNQKRHQQGRHNTVHFVMFTLTRTTHLRIFYRTQVRS